MLRNIAEYQGLPLLQELAEWQLGRGTAGAAPGQLSDGAN